MKYALCLGLVFALPVSAAFAAPANNPPAELRFSPYAGTVPACDDAGVLAKIQSRFEQKESEYWHSSLNIASYDRIRQYGFRTDGKIYIPKRFCTARALLSDNKYRQVGYWIGEDLGIIGFGFGVEFCVAGLDRNLAYAPACRAVRP